MIGISTDGITACPWALGSTCFAGGCELYVYGGCPFLNSPAIESTTREEEGEG